MPVVVNDVKDDGYLARYGQCRPEQRHHVQLSPQGARQQTTCYHAWTGIVAEGVAVDTCAEEGPVEGC